MLSRKTAVGRARPSTPLVEILVDRDGPLTRAAVLTNGRLTDLYIDNAERPSILGNVYLGRVERIVSGMDGAFVDLGTGTSGLLIAADARGPKGRVDRISTVLRTGQDVLVQVRADAVGNKGPSLTMDISLPGRFLIHTPLGRAIAVSKRLGTGPARGELIRRIETLVIGSGWIARAGAARVSDDALATESDALHQRWQAIELGAQSGGKTAPIRLDSGPGAAIRALVEHGASPSDDLRILVDNIEIHKEISRWCENQAEDLLDSLSLHRDSVRLFDLRDLDSAIDDLTDIRVPLSAGGSLVIERTEAMTVIDVNAGERANALETNLEAATEIARQLRLRNVGGIVVVDFVNMRQRGDIERLLNLLSGVVADDPAQTQVYGMSKLGLVEMTRARRGTELATLLRR